MTNLEKEWNKSTPIQDEWEQSKPIQEASQPDPFEPPPEESSKPPAPLTSGVKPNNTKPPITWASPYKKGAEVLGKVYDWELGAIKNIPENARAIGNAIIHPYDTVNSFAEAAAGGVRNLISRGYGSPEQRNQIALDKSPPQQTANAFAQGAKEAAKHPLDFIQKHPLDVALMGGFGLEGAGSLISRIPKTGGIGPSLVRAGKTYNALPGKAVKAGYSKAKDVVTRPVDLNGGIERNIHKIDKQVAGDILNIARPKRKLKTGDETTRYTQAGRDAGLDIIKNKDSLKFTNKEGYEVTGELPSTLDEFAQVSNARMKESFDTYNKMKLEAEGNGITFDYTPVIKELEEGVINNPSYQRWAPRAIIEAQEIIERLSKIPKATLSEVQNELQILNDKRFGGRAFDPNNPDALFVVNTVANKTGKLLDELVSIEESPKYSEFKKIYKDHRTIQEGLNHKNNLALARASQTPLGLWDSISLYQLGEAAVTGNIPKLAKAGIAETVSMLSKASRSADKPVRKFFKNLERRNELSKSIEPKVSPTPPPTDYQVKGLEDNTIKPDELGYGEVDLQERYTGESPPLTDATDARVAQLKEGFPEAPESRVYRDGVSERIYNPDRQPPLKPGETVATRNMQSGPLVNQLPNKNIDTLTLHPAIKVGRDIVEGELGETHAMLGKQRNIAEVSEANKGFAVNGKFLDRKEAIEWLKQNEFNTYKKWLKLGKRELHTEDLAKARGKQLKK